MRSELDVAQGTFAIMYIQKKTFQASLSEPHIEQRPPPVRNMSRSVYALKYSVYSVVSRFVYAIKYSVYSVITYPTRNTLRLALRFFFSGDETMHSGILTCSRA